MNTHFRGTPRIFKVSIMKPLVNRNMKASLTNVGVGDQNRKLGGQKCTVLGVRQGWKNPLHLLIMTSGSCRTSKNFKLRKVTSYF